MDEDGKSQARPGRIWILLALGVTAFALLVGIINISTREADTSYQEVLGASDTQRIYGGVRQLGDRLGSEDAPVQMEVFLDAQASEFRDQYLETIPQLVTTRVRSGQLQMALRNRSLNQNMTELAFYGIEAAAEQDFAWQFLDLMFRNQTQAQEKGRVDREFLLNLAGAIDSLDVEQWKADFDAGVKEDSAMTAKLEDQDRAATDLGIRAQPAAIVTGPSGSEVLQDSPDLAEIEAAIDKVR